MSRAEALRALLSGAGWAEASAVRLAGDASARSYCRLTRPDRGDTAILMDAPADAGAAIDRFVRIARHLAARGLSAPRLLAEDRDNGYLLLEDLGDALFARLVAQSPQREAELYRAATDLLLELHRHAAPGDTPRFGPAEMARAVEPALRWYARGCGRTATAAEAARCEALVEDALAALPPEPPVLALRDFHAENLIWLPGRTGAARVGLLDFQDAFAGPRAYDLVSLLADARRDVAPAVRAAMLDRYIARSGRDGIAFRAACATLGAQRNLRILGVFARLSMHFGKPQYLDLVPRVWANLQADLAHPQLAALAAFLAETLPVPTPDRLERIRSQCGTCPTP